MPRSVQRHVDTNGHGGPDAATPRRSLGRFATKTTICLPVERVLVTVPRLNDAQRCAVRCDELDRKPAISGVPNL